MLSTKTSSVGAGSSVAKQLTQWVLQAYIGSVMETNTDSAIESVVRLTENAANQIKTLLTEQPENQGKTLRVYVEGGGCSGMRYEMIFDEKREGDTESETFGVPVLIDSVSAEYLRGATVDYSEALTGGGFKILNPKAKQTCGCGKSFEA